MWTAPRVNGQLQPLALRSNVGSCITAQRTSKRPMHGHRQIRSRLSVCVCLSQHRRLLLSSDRHRLDGDLSGQRPQAADPSGPLRSNGKAWARRSVPHQAPARRVHGACPSPPPQFSSSDGIWRRQIEPRLTWCATARYGISCDKRRPCQSPRSNRTRCKARATANCIYKYQYGHLCRKVVADVGKNLSALARRSVSCALMSDL
jgi:hypothetical protein